jgi:hypothetical protein
MPHPFPLASVFNGGMRRDVDRTEIPGGSAYNMVDFIPDEVQAVTAGRGGWTYAGPALGSTAIQAVSFHPDTRKVVATDGDRKLWDVAAGTQIGTFNTQLTPSVCEGNVAYHRGLLIFVGSDGGTLPAYYKSDGTVGQLTAAPTGQTICVYKDHTVIARTPTQNSRVWFSAPGDPTTWDTSFGYWDSTGDITGIAPTLNSIIIFHHDSTERLRGTTPPPGSDFALEPLFPNVGCLDSRSIVSWQNRIIFASAQGIYMTDGASVVDLTAGAQTKSYWQSILSGYSRATWVIAGGVYRGHYIVSIYNGSGLVDNLCFSLENQTMWRFTNLFGSHFFSLTDQSQEKLYMGSANTARVAELSSLWNPSSTVKQDADGTSPTPIVETAMFRGFDRLHRRWIESMGKQKWRFAYVDYDLRDSASDNPTMTLSYCKTPTGSYTATDRTLPETTDISRVRRSLSPTQGGAAHSQMLGLKLAVTGPYASAKLLTLEGVFEPLEIGAL